MQEQQRYIPTPNYQQDRRKKAKKYYPSDKVQVRGPRGVAHHISRHQLNKESRREFAEYEIYLQLDPWRMAHGELSKFGVQGLTFDVAH